MTSYSLQITRVAYKSVSQLRQINQFYDLKKSQWLTHPMLQRVQEKKLRSIIKYAYDHVAYYHQLLKSLNLNPNDIQKVDDLCKIPILTKSEIQNNFEKITANNLDRNRCFSNKTSGTTGMPLTILYDDNAHTSIGSRHLRSYFECGLKFSDRIDHFSDPHHFHRNISWFNHLGILRKRNLSVFDRIDDHITKLIEHPPDAIEGYPSILFLIARKVQDRKIKEINPRLIFSTAELLIEGIRKKINSVFGTELFDRYGSVEFGTFAWECQRHNGYHLDIEDVVVEFLKNGETVSPGEKGEIVVTSLFNYAMPLIRYSLGDIGTLSNEQCSCGRGLPLMKIIDGRSDDFLVLPSGKRISPRNIGTLEYIDGIARWKIIQEKKDKIIVQIVKGENFSQETVEQVKEKVLRGCLGENVEIVIKLVEKIPEDRSGKIRMILSKVKA
jgi:phenylacetate-CoA ligase